MKIQKILRRDRIVLVAISFFIAFLLLAYFVDFAFGKARIEGFVELLERKTNLEWGATDPEPKPEPKPEPSYPTMLGGKVFEYGTEFLHGFALVTYNGNSYALSYDGYLYKTPDIYSTYVRGGYFVYKNNGRLGLRHITLGTIIYADFCEITKGVDFLLVRRYDYYITLEYNGNEIARTTATQFENIFVSGRVLLAIPYGEMFADTFDASFEPIYVDGHRVIKELYGVQVIQQGVNFGIAKNGEIITTGYDFVNVLSKRFAVAEKWNYFADTNYYLYDLYNGKVTDLQNFRSLTIFEDRFLLGQYQFIFELRDLWQELDFADIVPTEQTSVTTFSEVVFVYNLVYGTVIKEYFFGEFHLPVIYAIRPATEDFLIISRGQGWSVIDKSSQVIIDTAQSITYSGGVFRVSNNYAITYFSVTLLRE
ncbi:MAG: hypothetical protein FWC80_05565 [Firmicutes bacterium]|nr:hypothetical protein [Bacillota bacterium]